MSFIIVLITSENSLRVAEQSDDDAGVYAISSGFFHL